MPDTTSGDSTEPVSSPSDGSLAILQKSVRRIKIWLTVITVVVVLAVIGVSAVLGTFFYGFGAIDGPGGTSDEQIAKTKEVIQDAYGERLKDLEVRTVKLDSEVVPFPWSLMSGEEPQSLYVQYSFRDSGVVVADVVSGFSGEDVSSSGMVPTKGSLANRMSQVQFDRLLVAYAAETKSPLGSVHRYGRNSEFIDSEEQAPEDLTVGDKTYSTKELWSVAEGVIVKGDQVDMNDEANFSRNALVFREDPATGQFTFLGTEPAEIMW